MRVVLERQMYIMLNIVCGGCHLVVHQFRIDVVLMFYFLM